MEHLGHYNALTVNEVVVDVVNQNCDRSNIVILARDNILHRIAETDLAYDVLQHPLIFCRAEDGYHFTLKLSYWKRNK